MYITLTHLDQTYTLNLNIHESLTTQISNLINLKDISSIYLTQGGRPITTTNITKDMTINVSYRLKGGRALNENDKELVKLRNDVKVCYKCNCRLKLTMTHCRKIKCGKDSKLRFNKKRRQVGKK